MKNNLVSTLTAIALAVPLGISGLIITAPATASDASAQSATEHFFNTCSIWAIQRCHPDHQTYIFGNGVNFGYKSGRNYLPFGSDGADHKAYDYLKDRIDSGTLSAFGERESYGQVRTSELEHWVNAFNRFFPDGVRPEPPKPFNIMAWMRDQRRERLLGSQEGNTPEERLENFQDTCERVGGLLTMRFQFGDNDLGANQCRVETVEGDPNDVDEDTEIEIFNISFNPRPILSGPDDPFSNDPNPFLLQVTAIDPFSSTNINPFDDEEGEAVRQHREAIIELQDEVTAHDEAIATMLALQGMQTDNIRSNTSSIRALNSRVETFADDIQKNTAGIALAYAFPSAGLNYNESFRLSGGAGYFREEAAVAFGFTGRLSPTVTASGGVGLADGVTGGRVEIGYGW